MRTLFRTNWLSVALLSLALAGYASPMFAASTLAGELDFYSDATFTDQVGYWIKYCSGNNVHSGTQTSYIDYEGFYSCETGEFGCSDPQYSRPCLLDGYIWGCCH